METAALVKMATWALALFGGAHKLENLLENYVMPKVPDAFKGLVVPVISALFAVIAAVHGGVAPLQAGLVALGFAGYVDKVHNSPTTTSADWALPEPPADPLGVPGVQ